MSIAAALVGVQNDIQVLFGFLVLPNPDSPPFPFLSVLSASDYTLPPRISRRICHAASSLLRITDTPWREGEWVPPNRAVERGKTPTRSAFPMQLSCTHRLALLDRTEPKPHRPPHLGAPCQGLQPLPGPATGLHPGGSIPTPPTLLPRS